MHTKKKPGGAGAAKKWPTGTFTSARIKTVNGGMAGQMQLRMQRRGSKGKSGGEQWRARGDCIQLLRKT